MLINESHETTPNHHYLPDAVLCIILFNIPPPTGEQGASGAARSG